MDTGRRQQPPAQSGYILISAMLFLLVVTLISITALRTTALQQRMAGNLHDHQLAFHAAESALGAAEDWLASQTKKNIGSNQPTTSPKIWALDAPELAGMRTKPHRWWTENGSQYPLAANHTQALTEISSQPRVVIQYSHFARDSTNIGKQPRSGINYYRITAHGSGASDESAVIIRSSYAQRFH